MVHASGVKQLSCTTCSSIRVKKNGHTKNGKQRYWCLHCHSSFTLTYTREYKDFQLFLDYVLHAYSQQEYGIAARTLRARIQPYWAYWPIPERVDTAYDVVFVDGLYLRRNCVILIACTPEHIIGWYLARSEYTRAWEYLLSRISPPALVVSDGGQGFKRACSNIWPQTKIQRCLFHVYQQITRLTTLHPRLQPGFELLNIAKQLLTVSSSEQASQWVIRYHQWYEHYYDFLHEQTYSDHAYRDTHERLVKASRILNKLITQQQLFTNLNKPYQYEYKQHIIRTNNQIEGGVNKQLRILLHAHRGMSIDRQIKTIFWYCYTHSPFTQNPRDILTSMPTDTSITRLYQQANHYYQSLAQVPTWGTSPVYQEFHTTQ